MRRLQLHPALIAARVPVLEVTLRSTRAGMTTREHATWITAFLTRAGVDRASIDRVLQELAQPAQ